REIRAANRLAMSGTSLGWFSEGTQVTHVGAGLGRQRRIRSSSAATRSFANRPSSFLPFRTRLPQPESFTLPSALPFSAARPGLIAPLQPYTGNAPECQVRSG